VRRSPEWRPEGLAALHTRFSKSGTPVSRGCGSPWNPAELRGGHGDALVLRGLSELPVVLGR